MNGVRLLIPRAAVIALTRLALAGLAIMFALAASGCGGEVANLDEQALKACADAGGVPRLSGDPGWKRIYAGCDDAPAAARFRPDYYPPAEAPEASP